MPARRGRLQAAHDALEGLQVAELTSTSDAATRLAQVRAGTGLKMPSCWVLLVAEYLGARVASIDERLVTVAASRDLVVVDE